MLASYRRLLTNPGVPWIIAIGLFTRIGTPMLSLAMLLAAMNSLGSPGAAGLMVTGHAIALAACAPVGGRLTDRLGPPRALTGYLAAHTCAYAVVLTALLTRTPAAVLVAAAALLGATTPPVGAVIRGAWPRLVAADALPSAYAVDSAVNELVFITGPVLVSALTLVMPAQAVVAVAGASVIVASGALLASPAIRRKPPTATGQAEATEGRRTRPVRCEGRRVARRAGPLTLPTTLLLALPALGAFSFGCLRIATVAAADASGSVRSAGVLLGLLSAGALAGALIYGGRAWPVGNRAMLSVLCLLDAASMAAASLTRNLLGIAGLIMLTGLLTGPRDTLATTLLAERTPRRYRTEAFAWLNTFMWSGYGAGTALAGEITGSGDDGAAAFLAAATAALLATVLVAAFWRPAPDRVPTGLPRTPEAV